MSNSVSKLNVFWIDYLRSILTNFGFFCRSHSSAHTCWILEDSCKDMDWQCKTKIYACCTKMGSNKTCVLPFIYFLLCAKVHDILQLCKYSVFLCLFVHIQACIHTHKMRLCLSCINYMYSCWVHNSTIFPLGSFMRRKRSPLCVTWG